MSIVVDEASGPPSGSPESERSANGLGQAGRRGRTTVATGVVERVAGWVAATTDGVSAAELTGVRGWFHVDRDDTAEAQVDVGDDGLHIALSIAVTYPEPIAEVAARVRERVREELRKQLAMSAPWIDITVTELRHPRRDRVSLEERVS